MIAAAGELDGQELSAAGGKYGGGIGTDVLNDFCIDAEGPFEDLETESTKLLGYIRQISNDAKTRYQILVNIWNNPALFTSVGVSEYLPSFSLQPHVTLADVYIGIQSFDNIANMLSGSEGQLEMMVESIAKDRSTIKANIIPSGWAGLESYRFRKP
jgi:hypothetical protein